MYCESPYKCWIYTAEVNDPREFRCSATQTRLKAPFHLSKSAGRWHANEATTMTTICPPKQRPRAGEPWSHCTWPKSRNSAQNETSTGTEGGLSGVKGVRCRRMEEHNDVNWVNKRLASKGICGAWGANCRGIQWEASIRQPPSHIAQLLPPPTDTAYIHTYTSLSAYPVSRSNRKTAAKLLLVQRGPSTATRIHKIDGWLAGEASHIAATRDAARTPPPLYPPVYIYLCA